MALVSTDECFSIELRRSSGNPGHRVCEMSFENEFGIFVCWALFDSNDQIIEDGNRGISGTESKITKVLSS